MFVQTFAPMLPEGQQAVKQIGEWLREQTAAKGATKGQATRKACQRSAH